jgi:hypothetical protein
VATPPPSFRGEEDQCLYKERGSCPIDEIGFSLIEELSRSSHSFFKPEPCKTLFVLGEKSQCNTT